VKLRAQFDNSKGTLFPNEFVNTRLLVNTLENQTIVPSSAIQHNGTQDFVYLLQGLDPKNLKSTGKAVMKTVKSGVSDGGNTAVTGISPGNMVANSSFQKLVDGSPVIQSQVKIPATSTDTTEEAP
jgi:multidrug efflux system membrane fusion protein